MAILLKVNWIDRASDEQDLIKAIGGSSGELQWSHTEEQAIQSIEHRTFEYYIEQAGQSLRLEVGLADDGHKFLKTQADRDIPQHLLKLPSRT